MSDEVCDAIHPASWQYPFQTPRSLPPHDHAHYFRHYVAHSHNATRDEQRQSGLNPSLRECDRLDDIVDGEVYADTIHYNEYEL